MAYSTAQNSESAPAAAPLAEPPTSARAHVPKDGWEAAVRLPTRAPNLWTQVRMGATAVSIAENTAPSVASPIHARVHATLGGMEAAARLQRRAQPPHFRPRMGPTETFTASMAALLAEPQGHAPALHVMRDTEVRAARLPARALPLRIRAKMEPMEASIASTAAPWAELLDLDRALAPHVTRDTKARAARQPVSEQPPQSRQRTGATAPSTASTAALSAAPPDRALAQDAT